MRNLINIFLSVLFFSALSLTLGCGGGNSTNGMTPDEANEKGLVWNETTEQYEMPSKSGGPSDNYYEDDYAADAGDSDTDSDDADSDDYGANGSSDSQDGGGADDGASDSSGGEYASSKESDGYGDGYDNPYAVNEGDPKYYTEKVVPILRTHCYNCHGGGPRGQKGNISLHSPIAIEEAELVYARDVEGSYLYERITSTDKDERMPPRGPGLSKEEIAVIAKWIKDGASFGDAPRDVPPVNVGGGGDDGYGGEDGYSGYGRGGDSDGYDDDYEDEDGETRRAPVAPQNFAEWASWSFQNGHDQEAMNYLHANALVRSGESESTLDRYRWYAALKQPKLALRWGVGIKYAAKSGFTGSPRAVGVVQNLPGDDYDDVDESEDEARDFQNDTLDYYTGDIGDELLVRLRNRIERSDYGEVLKDELEKKLSARLGDDDDEYYDDDSGYGSGRGGGGYGGAYGRGGDGDSDEKPDGEKIEQLMPGVTLLGVAGNSDLFKRANEQGVDLMLVFDVSADPNRKRRFVDTTTRVRLYDVATKEQVAVSGKINNIEIQKARSEDPDDKTVIEEMSKVFDFVDKTYRGKPFPDVSSEKGKRAVISFVKNALASESPDPLWKLSEIRFYEHRGGLMPDHALAAMKKVLPAQAAKIQSASSEDEIRSLLSDWIKVKKTGSAGDADPGDDEVDSFR